MSATGTKSYEVTYFNVRALGDLPRLLLDISGAKWNDSFVDDESFITLKPFQRFGKVPRLTIKAEDGTESHLWESRAIHEYIADTFSLLPKEPFARADANSLVFSLYEVQDNLMALTYIPSTGKGEPIRREFWTQLRDERIPRMLEYHERFLVKEGTPFYLGKSIMLPDLVLFWLWSRLQAMFGSNLIINETKTPKLYAIVRACEEGKPGEYIRGWNMQPPLWNAEVFDWIYD